MFRNNPPRAEMILQNLSYRLRRLTQDYIALCGKIREKSGE